MTTMADIAREAKVSRSTVSFTLNNRYKEGVNITEETRARIKATAQKLNYCRNELAESVARGKSRMVGLVGLDSTDSENKALYAGDILTSCVKTLASRNYSGKIVPTKDSISEMVEHCVSYKLAGVIARMRDRDRLQQLASGLKRANIKLVTVDSEYPTIDIPSVNTDDIHGMELAVDHLATLNHNHLAYLSFDDSMPYSNSRKEGFLKATNKRHLTTLALLTDRNDPRHPHLKIESLVEQALKSTSPPTAFTCGCDEAAMILIRKASQMGVKIPQQLSVIGFGDLPMCAFANPPLTSIKRPYDKMGRRAIELILQSNDAAKNSQEHLSVCLIVRNSTQEAPK